MYTCGIVEDLFITQHTYLRIEVFEGVAKQLMKNVNSTRTCALITSQGVSRFKNLKRTKPTRVCIRIIMLWLSKLIYTEWNIIIRAYHWPALVIYNLITIRANQNQSYHSSQSQRTWTILWANQNFKQIHVHVNDTFSCLILRWFKLSSQVYMYLKQTVP